MKFGGSSVGTAEAIRQVAVLVDRERARQPVIIVSALQGVTDLLLKRDFESVRARHLGMLQELGSDGKCRQAVERLLADLAEAISEAGAPGVLAPWIQDEIVSFGERLSAVIVAGAVGSGESVDARECLVTDGRFTRAEVDYDASAGRIKNRIVPILTRGRVPVVTGFIGRGPDGRTTTLGRGGSDCTVTIFGAALQAEEIWIWKEVDGLMTADPRVVPDASVLPDVSYDEAAEMSYYGAKILHPSTMRPAMRQGVKIRMRNTFRPDAPGTLISTASTDLPHGVKAVTAIRNLAMVAVVGEGMRGRPGIAGRLFTALGESGVNILAIAQGSSERNITFIVRGEEADAAVRAAHHAFELEKINALCEVSI